MTTKSITAIIVTGILICFGAGCGAESPAAGDDEPGDHGSNHGDEPNGGGTTTPGDTDAPGTDDPGSTGGGANCSTINGVSNNQFDSLLLSEPAHVAGLINGLLASSLADGTVCVLIQIQEDGQPGSIAIRGDACVSNDDGTVSWSPQASSDTVRGTVDASCTFANDPTAGLPTLNFPVEIPGSEPLVLPIRNIKVTGTIGGSGISSGNLTGAIAGADADEITIDLGGTLTRMSDVLGDSNKNVDSNGDGSIDGWGLSANFTASNVEFQ